MALYLKKIDAGNDIQLALWKIEESESEFYSRFPFLVSCKTEFDRYSSLSRRLESLAVRALLFSVLNENPVLTHLESGRPLLGNGYNLSVSHTKGMAAVILSRQKNVAVDIEYVSDRVRRVAPRFMRDDEKTDNLGTMLVCWCAKETLYKLHSEDKLDFSDIRTVGIPESLSRGGGSFEIVNRKRNQTVAGYFFFIDNYVCTYSFE